MKSFLIAITIITILGIAVDLIYIYISEKNNNV